MGGGGGGRRVGGCHDRCEQRSKVFVKIQEFFFFFFFLGGGVVKSGGGGGQGGRDRRIEVFVKIKKY